MKILVTGAGGFVGQKIAEHFGAGHETAALGRSALDITDESSVADVVSRLAPDLVVNCAVLGLEASEGDLAKARAVNVDGPANLGRAAVKAGASVVHLSTNYIFGGDRREGFYTTDDEPQPVNVYGETKWEGERVLAAECDRHFILRTSWVYGGSKLSFFDKAIASLRMGDPMDAIEDNWGSPTFVDDLVERIQQIVDRGHFGTYHAANSGVCSRYEFAVEAARVLGADSELVRPVLAEQLGSSVRRPAYTPIECKLSSEIGLPPLRDWESALKVSILRS
jgi:dTDP-4-dehydrorhamnose reductase